MSIKAVEWAFGHGLTGSPLNVLVMLANCINCAHEFAFPSRVEIASRVGKTERQVHNCLRLLEAAGLVRCVRGPARGKGKGRHGVRYYLACDHVTGADRPFAEIPHTTGNPVPVVSTFTTGNPVPLAKLTTGNPRSLQPEIHGHPYIEEPEKEPEPSSREREANHHLLSPGEPATPAGKGSGNGSAPKLDGKRAIALFNEAAERRGWCVAKGAPSPQRKAAIAARLREHGMDGWVAQLALAERMPFLRGENDRGWRMGLDYFARPSGWAKIAEGGFRTDGAKPKSRFSADNPPPGYRFGGYGEDGAARYLRDESKNFYR